MLMASHIPIAIKATVKAKAATFASMRWRKSSGSSRGALIARQVIGLGAGAFRLRLLAPVTLPALRADRVAWPEFEHPMLFFRRNGPLGFHCCQFRDILMLFSTLATRLTDNVGMVPR